MKHIALATGLALFAAPAFAQSADTAPQGDVAAGEEAFNRQCVACHVVVNDEGETLAGRGGQVGPNLYGVAMRTLGTVEGYNYGDSLVELGETGAVWTEENFVGYVQDPTGWLREELDNNRARGKMAFQVRSEEDALNLYAYLADIGPEVDMSAEGETEEEGS